MEKDTEHIHFIVGNDQIVYINCHPNTIMDLEQGLLSTRVVRELTNFKPVLLLCDLTNIMKITRECRDHFAGPEHGKIYSKCALVVKGPMSRIIGNFFLRANKPVNPTRLFSNRKEAVTWLKNGSHDEGILKPPPIVAGS